MPSEPTTEQVIADAKLALPEFATDGKTPAQIRVGVLDHVIASDDPRKEFVTKMLNGTTPAKAYDFVVRAAFDMVVALRPTPIATTSPTTGRSSASDGKEWTGEELHAYRLTHGGQSPATYVGEDGHEMTGAEVAAFRLAHGGKSPPSIRHGAVPRVIDAGGAPRTIRHPGGAR